MKLFTFLCSLVVIVGLYRARGMDRFVALAGFESGDNDFAIGARGEVSRYQIRPVLWDAYASPVASPTNQHDAIIVARAIQKRRCELFKRNHHREPTDYEFYILWNAPAEIDNPSEVVKARAMRYRNLCEL